MLRKKVLVFITIIVMICSTIPNIAFAAAGIKINTSPVAISATKGEDVTFRINAKGEGLTYQWQMRIKAGEEYKDIKGATKSEYTIKNVLLSWSHRRFRVIVSDADGHSVTSDSANLVVTKPEPTPEPTKTATPTPTAKPDATPTPEPTKEPGKYEPTPNPETGKIPGPYGDEYGRWPARTDHTGQLMPEWVPPDKTITDYDIVPKNLRIESGTYAGFSWNGSNVPPNSHSIRLVDEKGREMVIVDGVVSNNSMTSKGSINGFLNVLHLVQKTNLPSGRYAISVAARFEVGNFKDKYQSEYCNPIYFNIITGKDSDQYVLTKNGDELAIKHADGSYFYSQGETYWLIPQYVDSIGLGLTTRPGTWSYLHKPTFFKAYPKDDYLYNVDTTDIQIWKVLAIGNNITVLHSDILPIRGTHKYPY